MQVPKIVRTISTTPKAYDIASLRYLNAPTTAMRPLMLSASEKMKELLSPKSIPRLR